MRIRKLAFRGMAMTTAVLAVAALTPGAASAADPMEQCKPGWFCMWEHRRGGGRFYGLRNADSPNFGPQLTRPCY